MARSSTSLRPDEQRGAAPRAARRSVAWRAGISAAIALAFPPLFALWFVARERWARTRRAIDGLPENQRAVVLLARFEGLSQREIAEALGISEGAVESRLVRAMRTLREADGAVAARGAREPQEAGPPGVSRKGMVES